MDHLSPSSCIEKYNFTDVDDVVQFAFGKNVHIHVGTDGVTRQRDSKRSRSQILTDYKWENKTCYGRTLAVRDNLIAYRLFNENTGEAVRVLERETRARRLIKDFNRPIVDIQWASHAPFLAVLDVNGSIYVYQVDEKTNTLSKYLNVIHSKPPTSDCVPLLTWCPFIPEDDAEANKDVHMLAVAFGKSVYVYSLNTIKDTVSHSETDFEQVQRITGGVLIVNLDSEVTSVRLSPDATAMAVASKDAYVSFYVIDSDRTRFANRVRPLTNTYADGIMFLDNLTAQNQEQFWKYMVLSSDAGRRLAIYDCDSWECLGKLRFESHNEINRLDFSMDDSAHFIFMADYDSSTLYCLELTYIMGQPCFTSCTRVTFINSLVSITPCGLTENLECELSLEDENSANGSLIANFITLTNRSLMETNIELERHQLDPNSLILKSVNSLPEVNTLEAVELGLLSLSTVGANQPVASDSGNVVDASSSDNVMPADLKNLLESRYVPKKASLSHSHQNLSISGDEFALKLSEALDKKLAPFFEKINALQVDIQKLQTENQILRRDNADNFSNAIEKIANEVKEQSLRVDTLINDAATTSREQIVAVIEASMAASTHNFQMVASLSKNEILANVSATVQKTLVPAVEDMCAQLLSQMNEKVRDGLQEFMDQLAQFQRETTLFFMKRTY